MAAKPLVSARRMRCPSCNGDAVLRGYVLFRSRETAFGAMNRLNAAAFINGGLRSVCFKLRPFSFFP